MSHCATVTLKTRPRTVVVPGKKKGPIVTLKLKRHRFKCHVRLRVTGVDIWAGGEHMAGITEREAVQLHRSLGDQLDRIKSAIRNYDL